MNHKLRFSLGIAFLVTSAFVVSAAGPVHAITYPAARSSFPACSSEGQEFCIQEFAFTPTSGASRNITPAEVGPGNVDADGKPEVNVVATLSAGYAGTSSTPGQDGILASLSLNFYDPLGDVGNTGITKTGLRDGLYKVVVRTGDFDPSSMMLIANYDTYEVAQGADGYFTITLTARPTYWAAVVQLNGDDSVFNACVASHWVANCEANMASRSYILATFNMLDTAPMRAAARGSWVSTNASTVRSSVSSAGELGFTAEGPHYLPSDFELANAVKENGRSLNPAFFKFYVPYQLIALSMSQLAGRDISLQEIATLMEKPSEFLKGTIWQVTGNAAPVEVPQTLDIQPSSNGALVDFKLTHFSAPNPTLKFNAPQVTKATKTATLRIAKSSKFTAIATIAKLTYSKTSKVSLVVAMSSKKICRVAGTALKGLKAGVCKVTVTVTTSKGKKTSQTLTLKVAK